MKLRFISGNEHKIREVDEILKPMGIVTLARPMKLHEIQTEDVAALVRDKTLKAFQQLGRPVFVEHTGLKLKGLNDLPGGLTQIFWDRLQADAFTQLVHGLSSQSVVAETVIGYCDGKRFYLFPGRVEGTVPPEPRGNRDFQWDCVFVPDGHTETFAEMGSRKNEMSMRRKALEGFAEYLKSGRHK